jgi:hypothetical protein
LLKRITSMRVMAIFTEGFDSLISMSLDRNLPLGYWFSCR